MRNQKATRKLIGMAIAFVVLVVGLWFLDGKPKVAGRPENSIRVLTYSSFLQSWGPGPELAALFLKTRGIAVEFVDAGDAGLLLKKLELFPADAVVGLDQFSIDSPDFSKWQAISSPNAFLSRFIPIDHAPLTFIYRAGEIDPPKSLDDLLDSRFRGTIALEDPRTSAPGFLFLVWVILEKGEDEGFKFLERLKPNVQSVSPSWSTAYGLFTKKQAKLAFSYQTSVVYHWINDHDTSYAAVDFPEGHVQQTEYAAVPSSCTACDSGRLFIEFLRSHDAQTLIMKKNFMLPADMDMVAGTVFAKLPASRSLDAAKMLELGSHRDQLLARWQSLGL